MLRGLRETLAEETALRKIITDALLGVDLTPLCRKVFEDVGVDLKKVDLSLYEEKEARWEGIPGAGAVGRGDGGRPCVAVVIYWSKVGNGTWCPDLLELRDTLYHELAHILLEDAGEEEVVAIAEILTLRLPTWKYWRHYLRSKANALGLAPSQGLSLWQWLRVERRLRTMVKAGWSAGRTKEG